LNNQIHKYQQALKTKHEPMDSKSKEEMILENAPVVKYIADRLEVRLPACMSRDDLISAGILGLNDALDKFDASKGAKFKTYAEYRIKGAMLDELRKMGWASRSVITGIKKIESAMNTLKFKFGREPEDFEIADEMGVDIDTYYKMLLKSRGACLLSLDEVMPDGKSPGFTRLISGLPSSLDELKIKELKGIIARAISNLPKKEQIVISLYYYDELTLKEIGRVLDLTESRISQIHSKTIIRLRSALRSYYESA